MAERETSKVKFFMTSVKDIFVFFFSLGKRAKKTKVFYLISFLPVVMALIIKFSQIFSGNSRFEGIFIFSNLIIGFYLQFLILILALFFGTSVCSEEMEGKTLTYLTTRPVPKSAIIVGKYAAYVALTILMVVVGVVFSFLILIVDDLLHFSLYVTLLKNLAVLILGLICYTAFFTFIGTFLKRSIMFGLLFSFGWESVIQYFPGSTQRFAIVHYLKSLLPVPPAEGFAFLLFRLEPTPPGLAIFMLFLITAAFLGLACLVFHWKEYIFED
ncbi:MAG: ABC transporter permease [Candidatus Aminicenantes bacterium]|nr:ABC transporter permease [Candidatus Aminicenantes bacterium]